MAEEPQGAGADAAAEAPEEEGWPAALHGPGGAAQAGQPQAGQRAPATPGDLNGCHRWALTVGAAVDRLIGNAWFFWPAPTVDTDCIQHVEIKGPLPRSFDVPTTNGHRLEALDRFAALRRHLAAFRAHVFATDKRLGPGLGTALWTGPGSFDLMMSIEPGDFDGQDTFAQYSCLEGQAVAVDVKFYSAVRVEDLSRWLVRAAQTLDAATAPAPDGHALVRHAAAVVFINFENTEEPWEVGFAGTDLVQWLQDGQQPESVPRVVIQRGPVPQFIKGWPHADHAIWDYVVRTGDCGADEGGVQWVALAAAADVLLPPGGRPPLGRLKTILSNANVDMGNRPHQVRHRMGPKTVLSCPLDDLQILFSKDERGGFFSAAHF